MLIRSLDFVVDYVNQLNYSLKQISSNVLTKTQSNWLVVILMGLIVTGAFNWSAFARKSLGAFSEDRLRWIFHNAKISWNNLLQASISYIIAHYNISEVVLVLDDSDKMRSKNTSKIAHVHKIKDKKTGGFFLGQEFVFLIFVTKFITIPVGFRFYTPNPAIAIWKKTIKEQKAAGIPSKDRARKPEQDSQYPNKNQLALNMLKEFAINHPNIKIQAVLADALYGNANFMDQAVMITRCSQVISQLKRNQLVRNRNKNIALTKYFERVFSVKTILTVRGSKDRNVTISAARLIVKSHGKKRFIIALKYDGESEYRFIAATDLTWRHQDIARTYTLRWLVEVFIADWKVHGGWNTLSKQQGDDSAMRGITLSLLCDHLLVLHPLQSYSIKNNQSAITVGCLIEHINVTALMDSMHHVISAKEPIVEFDKFQHALKESLSYRKSTKHLVGLDLGRMEPTPSLQYKYKKAA